MIRKLFYALRFMTSLPLPWRENEDMVQISRASGFFPLVGLIIGGLLLAVHALLSQVFSPLTTAVFQTLAWVLITGGLHLDGLSDTMDGLGSRRDRERMLEIMKDSSIGAFGALSLIIVLMLKTVLCLEVNSINPLLILLAPLTARWGQLISIRYFKPARKDGMGRFFQEYMRNRELAAGLFTVLAVYAASGNVFMMLLLPLHGLTVYLLSRNISNRLGGLTGDVYGFICETGEVVTLILILLTAALKSTVGIQLPWIF